MISKSCYQLLAVAHSSFYKKNHNLSLPLKIEESNLGKVVRKGFFSWPHIAFRCEPVFPQTSSQKWAVAFR
jgi:hypothetical protein